MKTTLNIETVITELKREAARQGRTLSELVIPGWRRPSADEIRAPRQARVRADAAKKVGDARRTYEAGRRSRRYSKGKNKKSIDDLRMLLAAFAQAGRNFDRSPPSALFEFVRLVNQLPEPWWSWLQSNLKEGCHSAPFGTRSNIPAEFFRLQLQRSARATKLSRNSRVFTQISQALFSPVPEDLLREESKACFWVFR
jgi:hypothetical protein